MKNNQNTHHKISVIIVNYNVMDFLVNCIDSIYKSDIEAELEIIVVDNNSFDGSVDFVSNRFEDVLIIENKRNEGFAKAVNQGIDVSSGDYIFILNPDTVIQERTLHVLLNYMSHHPKVGLCGPKILNADGSLQITCKRSFPTPLVALPKVLGLSSLFPKSRCAGKYNLTYLNPDETQKVDAVSGSCMFFSRTALEIAGKFDESFFMFGEDLDICYRIKETGFEVYYVPQTQIIHYKGESVKLAHFDAVKNFYDAMTLFVEKHFSPSTSFAVRWALKLGIFLRRIYAIISTTTVKTFPALIDLMIIVLSFGIAIPLRFGNMEPFFTSYIPVLFIYTALWLFVGYIFQLYSTHVFSYHRAVITSWVSFLLCVTFTYFFKQFAFSRFVLITASGIVLVLMTGWRLILHFLLAKGYLRTVQIGKFPLFSRRVVVYGTGIEGRRIAKRINIRLDTGLDFAGFVISGSAMENQNDQKNLFSEDINEFPVLGSRTSMREIINAYHVRELIFTSDTSNEEIQKIMTDTCDLRLNYRIVPRERDLLLGKAFTEEIGDIPVVDVKFSLYNRFNVFSKRSFDLVLSGLFIVLLSPLYLILKMKYPKWEHVNFWGREGSSFQSSLIPSRSSFVRKLPLLFNIFSGKISFVGSTLEQTGLEKLHLFCKPGLTGIDKIKPIFTPPEERTNYESYYLQNQSLLLDLEILLRIFYERRFNG